MFLVGFRGPRGSLVVGGPYRPLEGPTGSILAVLTSENLDRAPMSDRRSSSLRVKRLSGRNRSLYKALYGGSGPWLGAVADSQKGGDKEVEEVFERAGNNVDPFLDESSFDELLDDPS